MADRRVFQKTFRAADALKDGTLGLTPAQKYVLIQIDGSRDVETILQATADLGDFRGVFQELDGKGLVTAFSVDSQEDASPAPPAASKPAPPAAGAPAPSSPGQGREAAPPAAGADPRLLDPSAPADDALRHAATRAVYQALGPEADRFVQKIEGATRNGELLRQVEHALEVVEGMGRPAEALARLVAIYRLRSPASGPPTPTFGVGTPASAPAPVDAAAAVDKDLRQAGTIALYAVLGAEAEPFLARLAKARSNQELLVQLTLDAELAESQGRSASALRRLLADPRYQPAVSARAPEPRPGAGDVAKASRWSLGRLLRKEQAPEPAAGARPAPGRAGAAAATAPLRSLAPSAAVGSDHRQRAIDALYASLGPDADRFVLRVEKAKTCAQLVQQLDHDVAVIEGMGRPTDALQLVLDGPPRDDVQAAAAEPAARTAPAAAPSPRPAPERPASAPVPPVSSLAAVRENVAGIVKIGFAADAELFQVHLERAVTIQELAAAADRIRSLLQRIGREELAEAVTKELAKLPRV